MKNEVERELIAQGIQRLADKVTPIYRAVVFQLKLKTNEYIHVLKVGGKYYELERELLTELENGQIFIQAYVSSYALDECLFYKTEDYETDNRFLYPMYVVTLEDARTYGQDPEGTPIVFGSRPYYLILIRQ